MTTPSTASVITKRRRSCARATAVAVFAVLLLVGSLTGKPSRALSEAPAPTSAPPASVTQSPPPEPSDYRHDNYRAPVPKTLSGARVVTGEEAITLWHAKTSVFIDVFPRAPKPANLPANTIWRDHAHQTIENAHWVPNVGYGKLSPDVDGSFRQHLKELSAGQLDRQLVFFCLRNCWMSWNAAKRAMSYGYTTVIWFPDGTDAWQELGQLVVDTQPRPLVETAGGSASAASPSAGAQ